MTGDSGAGKTESTKLMVKHFVHMCPQGSGDLHDKVIEVKIYGKKTSFYGPWPVI